MTDRTGQAPAMTAANVCALYEALARILSLREGVTVRVVSVRKRGLDEPEGPGVLVREKGDGRGAGKSA